MRCKLLRRSSDRSEQQYLHIKPKVKWTLVHCIPFGNETKRLDSSMIMDTDQYLRVSLTIPITQQKKPGLNLSPGFYILFFIPMDELKELTLKLVDYHNKIVEVSNTEEPLSDELSTEIANYLSNEVPPILLKADKIEAHACISAMCKWFPTPFLCNVLTALVLYIFTKRIDNEQDSWVVDTNILVTDRK